MKWVVGIAVFLGACCLLVVASTSTSRNERLALNVARFADPTGFKFDKEFHHRYGQYLFISDHELIVREIGSLKVTPVGIWRNQEYLSFSGLDESGRNKSQLDHYRLIDLKTETSSSTTWDDYRPIDFDSARYMKNRVRKSYFQSFDQICSVSLDGKRTISLEPIKCNAGQCYWSRVEGLFGWPNNGLTIVTGPNAGLELSCENSQAGYFVSPIGESYDESLLIAWFDESTGQSLRKATLENKKLRDGEPILVLPNYFSGDQTWLSLDGQWFVHEMRDLQFIGNSTIVATNLKTLEVLEVGKLSGQYLEDVVISPSNDYVVFQTPGGLYWKRFKDMRIATEQVKNEVICGMQNR